MKGSNPYIYVLMGKIACCNLNEYEKAISLLAKIVDERSEYQTTVYKLLGFSHLRTHQTFSVFPTLTFH